ncbi:MAG: DMT family transporter [Cellvibrionaceae bacterium]
MQKSELHALGYGLTAVLLWSTVASVFKIGLQLTSIIALLTGACFFSVLALSLILVCKKQWGKAIASLWQYRIFSIKLGLLNPVVYYLVLFEAYDRLPAQVAQPINYTWGIVLGLIAIPVLGKKITRYDIFGMILAYAGVFIISIAGKNMTGELDYFGVLLALLSTGIWAGYWLVNMGDDRPPVIALFHNFLFALPVLVIIASLTGATFNYSYSAIASMAYIGLFEMGFTFILWTLALQKTQYTARISSLIFLSPVISLFIIHKVLGEPLQISTFVGLSVIIAGLAVQQLKAVNK